MYSRYDQYIERNLWCCAIHLFVPHLDVAIQMSHTRPIPVFRGNNESKKCKNRKEYYG